MKVIASAENNPNLWTAQVSCTGFGISNNSSPLEINMIDIKKNSYKHYDDYDFYYSFVCPVCGCKTELTGKLKEEYLKAIQQKI